MGFDMLCIALENSPVSKDLPYVVQRIIYVVRVQRLFICVCLLQCVCVCVHVC